MLNVELYFNTIIAKHNVFKQAAILLLQDVPILNAEQICRRSEELTVMHRGLIEDKEQFFTIIEFFGPGILETAYIGDFQRALDKSVAACEALYQEIIVYRDKLSTQDRNDACEVDLFSLIPPGTPIQ
jgi:hypothetical protein